ncbi:hypothetical protein GCM10010398_20830 [Streptomyces fimbriatus]
MLPDIAEERPGPVDDERRRCDTPGDRVRRWQKTLGYVHGSADPLQHLVDGWRALAGLLADGYHRPCSAFPGPEGPSGRPRGLEPDFPITVARAAPVSHRISRHQGVVTVVPVPAR